MTVDLANVPVGFTRPVFDAQVSFRRVLDAMARPGRLQSIDVVTRGPTELHGAATAIALTLFDQDTPVWLSPSLTGIGVRTFLGFHCGCPFVADPERARFALVHGWTELPRLDTLDAGTDHYPDRSCTVILQTDGFESGPDIELRGPGIAAVQRIRLAAVPATFIEWWGCNREQFPRGIDLILVHAQQVVGVPRTTRMTPME